MGYEEHYGAWMERHRRARKGEGLRRLEEHGYAERLFLETVWWPAVGSLDDLVPEYEIRDFKDGSRFLDYAYLRRPYRICIELDGYGPHLRDMSRHQFADQLRRQNDLVNDGWKVYRLSVDEVKERPRSCQNLLQMWLGRWYGGGTRLPVNLSLQEKEIVRMAVEAPEGITVPLAAARLEVTDKTARNLMHRLTEVGILKGKAGAKRIHRYNLDEDWHRFADLL